MPFAAVVAFCPCSLWLIYQAVWINSISVQFPCEVPLFSCLSGHCINMSQVNDGEVDCDDASDEGW